MRGGKLRTPKGGPACPPRRGCRVRTGPKGAHGRPPAENASDYPGQLC
jgi:hypothetical protein